VIRRRLLAALAGAAALAGGVAAAAAPTSSDMSLGNPKARVKVVEYASASCLHCAHFNNDVFPAFRKKYIDTGKVHYTLREMLTPPANFAAAAFVTARCAGPGRYFTVLDTVYRGLENLYEGGDPGALLTKAGAAGGLSKDKVQACLSDQAAAEALDARVAQAREAGVSATPTFFVNGKMVAQGAMTLPQLDAAIAAAGK
jgi:protein-disulfide isomerase